MRLVAWDVGHQTKERALKPGVAQAIQALAADVLTLNEYVHGPSRGPFLDELASVRPRDG